MGTCRAERSDDRRHDSPRLPLHLGRGVDVTHLFPIIIIVLSYLAGGVYIFKQMWLPALYWGCAGTLNLSVLLMSTS